MLAEQPPGSFDVRRLAATAADLLVWNTRARWRHELERWLVHEGIAKPNGTRGRLDLTPHGADLASTTAAVVAGSAVLTDQGAKPAPPQAL